MAGPVLDVADERIVGAGELEDAGGELAVRDLLATTDVVDPAGLPLAQDQLDSGAMVFDVQPVTRLTAVAVDGQRLAVERVRDEERDDLLGILVRPEGIRAAGDRGVDAVGADGGKH